MDNFSKISNDFIRNNEGIIRIALNKYLYNFGINEDILQEARIWLCEAKQKYNKKRGSSWSTYAKYYIQQSYLAYVKKGKRLKRNPEVNGYSVIPIEDCLNTTTSKNGYSENYEKTNKIKYEALLVCCDEEIENKLLYDMALTYLPTGRNKDITILVSQGFTYDEIRKKYGNISRERIRQIYYRQIEIIKEHMV